ncbi:MAG: Crp/Fnr family transcriptional regulator [Pseudomonadota bacterium]
MEASIYQDYNIKNALSDLPFEQRQFKAGDVIFKKGDDNSHFLMLEQGWAFAVQYLDQDLRSIQHVKIPQDHLGYLFPVDAKYSYDVIALTDATVSFYSWHDVSKVVKDSEFAFNTFSLLSHIEKEILHQRIISIGRRTALEKAAHLILEMQTRIERTKGGTEKGFYLPLKQDHMADLLGLSSIHVNRSMNELRRHNYIEYNRSDIRVINYNGLAMMANFDPSYLQFKPDFDEMQLQQQAAE